MKRRDFVFGVSATALFSARAASQQSNAVIGLLGTSTYDDYRPMIDLFRKGIGRSGIP
jgi:hypothetical protein